MKKLDITLKKSRQEASKSIWRANLFVAYALIMLCGLPLGAQTAIGHISPDESAMLDVQSNERGVLFPRMTTAERMLINPAPGLMIFNTTENRLQINVGTPGNADWRNFLFAETLTSLNCGSATLTGTLSSGQPASSVSVSLPYTGGKGGGYFGQTATSSGVSGLTATLSPGTFAIGGGTLTYQITGTPASGGTATFQVQIGGRSCTLSVDVLVPFTLDCNAAIRKGEMQPNDPIIESDGVVVIVPYAGGNGMGYLEQTVYSTGIEGYSATLDAGNFAIGNGTLTYKIEGPGGSSSGTASFQLDIGGSSCALDLGVKSCSANISTTASKTFGCYNLGAYNTREDPFTPNWQINGGYWQWGRKAEAAAGPVGSGPTQANDAAISGWNSMDAPDFAWDDGVKTTEDPCPSGFRIPTVAQWDLIKAENTQSYVGSSVTWAESITNYSTGIRFGSDLFLPAAGGRNSDSGFLFLRGNGGYYWSSTGHVAFASDAYTLVFSEASGSVTYNTIRANGFSIRCIAE